MYFIPHFTQILLSISFVSFGNVSGTAVHVSNGGGGRLRGGGGGGGSGSLAQQEGHDDLSNNVEARNLIVGGFQLDDGTLCDPCRPVGNDCPSNNLLYCLQCENQATQWCDMNWKCGSDPNTNC